MITEIVLASASPRRTELLSQLGIAHRVFPVDIDESPLPEESPVAQVYRLAESKAQRGFALLKDEASVVLAADTLIEFNGRSLGKPRDLSDSINMLTALSNASHDVHTSISVMSNEKQLTQVITTKVHFASLSEEDIIQYWNTGEPQDKAGSYAIQGIGGQFVRSIEGSPSAVIGLPLYETVQLLKQFGVAK